MGGSSSKTNTSAYNTTNLGSTTTSNPYAVSHTNNQGTTSNFQQGTALETIYNTVNQNMGKLLDEYLNPSLDSTTNKARLKNFSDTLKSQTYQNLENNIINPLAQRKMIRSSQATDLYNKASQNASSQIASYANDLISNSRAESADMITNLLNAYLQGYNVIKNNQSQSLSTSKSNASSYSGTNSVTSTSNNNWFDTLFNTAVKVAASKL